MRIVDRQTFLALPERTIYCKGPPFAFGVLSVKAASLETDWVCLELNSVDAGDSGEQADREFEMLEKGASYPMNTDFGRDGCFDKDEVFLVFERDDLLTLRAFIDAALELNP